jgi:hypothetical protein
MQPVSVVPELHVKSIAGALPVWEALGFTLAFAFCDGRPLPAGSLKGATLARLDVPAREPISVFLQTGRAAPGAVVHVMLSSPADVDAANRRLMALGATIHQPPTDQPWGMRDLQAEDRDGNLLIVGAARDAA